MHSIRLTRSAINLQHGKQIRKARVFPHMRETIAPYMTQNERIAAFQAGEGPSERRIQIPQGGSNKKGIQRLRIAMWVERKFIQNCLGVFLLPGRRIGD